ARKSDIPILVAFFASTMARKTGKPIQGFTTRSMDRMVNYAWPGNVRGLQNVVERAAILATGPLLDLEGVNLVDQRSTPTPTTPIDAANHSTSNHSTANVRRAHRLQDVERQHILDVLKNTHGVVEGAKGAATILGMHPNTLRSRMKKLGIS